MKKEKIRERCIYICTYIHIQTTHLYKQTDIHECLHLFGWHCGQRFVRLFALSLSVCSVGKRVMILPFDITSFNSLLSV